MKKRSYLPMILFFFLLMSLLGIYFFLDQGIVGIEKSSEVTRIQQTNLPVKVHFIDVGQGDAIFLEILGENILIDAGEREAANTIITYLQSYDVEKLHRVFLTHPHEDHMGGMGDVLEAFDIGAFYRPDKELVTKSFQRMSEALEKKNVTPTLLRGGQRIEFAQEVYLDILSPNRDVYLNVNNYSPIMRLVVGQKAFLFTGDAEAVIEEEVLSLHRELQADVLQVPHHGSKTSSTEAFIQAVSPRYAVISSGLQNMHNLPSPEILLRYEAMGSSVLLTEELGSIVFGTDGKEVIPLSN